MSTLRIDIDARGHRCPVPTLKLQSALTRAEPGTTAALLCDDPLARVDVAHFARSKGYEVVSQEDVIATAGRSDAVLFLVRKPIATGQA